MNILDFDEIKEDFDNKIFANSKADLITKLSKNPSRYVGLFRSSNPKTKLLQNITQSHEIKFGDGCEILIRKLFEKFGFKNLERNRTLENGDEISFDQLIKKNGELLFIEQKVRDDHDSTKKRGQFENFKIKLDYLINNENFASLRSYIYFIDPSLTKNKNYYLAEIEKINSRPGININLAYGDELFVHESIGFVWDEEIVDFLSKWRKNLPNFPELNFDKEAENTFSEIKCLSVNTFQKLFTNKDIVTNIFPIIFPTGSTLILLKDHFHSRSTSNNTFRNQYSELKKILDELGY